MRLPCQNFIVKNMIPGEYEYQQGIQKPLASCPNLRTVFSQKVLSVATRKGMLKSALAGLLHERNIIHTDIKPNNILLDYEKTNETFTVTRVQISHLEDAVILPPGKYLREGLCATSCGVVPSPARAAQGTPSASSPSGSCVSS
ncbi:hypothetical protein GMDG_06513 [Pseudogymnoascus destructans 20631-21]|uniref:Protein kinase domain-containing protein n=1 Tax=Pseudogymnoascus destructans (strain ATCC MYA-4855 / 20631-21) TaxID=658429 RepID=L8FU39_PSED2|nr:hypothetical protein GMDG_06513 [Pseudogymnoascus destructans 20631-21]